MMEAVLEMILTILLLPFGSKRDRLLQRINRMNSKPVRIAIKLLMALIPAAVLFALICLCSYLIRGYWI